MMASLDEDRRLSRAEPVQEFGHEVADDDGRSGTKNTFGAFKGHRLQVEHASIGTSVDHGELSADLVGGHGHVLSNGLGIADDVEIAASGLNHDDVGALGDVTVDGASGQTTSTRRKLVALAVTKRRAGPSGLAERTVQTTAELGAVGHQKHLVSETSLDKLEFDGANTSVVHVRWCNAVSTRLRVGQGHVGNTVDGHGVVERAIVSQDATVSVGSVFAEADIGDDVHVGELLANEANGLNDGALGIVCRSTQSILGRWRKGDAKEDNGAQAFVDQGGQERNKTVDATTKLARQGRNWRLFIKIIGDEERVNEHGLCFGNVASATNSMKHARGKTHKTRQIV